jgi:CHAD domain-containing protein
MAHKSAVAKQQDTSQSPANAAQDPPAHLTATANAFNLAVAQCVQDTDPDAVHRLRTGSRRLQAMLEATLRENTKLVLQQPAKAWLRQLKQARRAAGAVRDLDVHRKLLEHWVGKESPLPGAAPGSPLHKQAQMLDAWLQGERKHLAHGMQKQIRKRQQGLEERQAAFLITIGSIPTGSVGTSRSADAVALEDFVRAADSMPLLHAENLHDFRKATKKARYVAESGAEGQAYSSVAKALKRVQDAIGDWHDWLCLQEEAKEALGQDAPDLTAFLEREVERHFATAMKTTQTMRARLSGEWMAMKQPPAKRPPTAVTIKDRRLASGF